MTAVLQRKLAQAQSDRPTSDMTALRALRLSLARAGDALFDLPLAMLGGKQTRLAPDEIDDLLSNDDLLVVLDCPGGQTGVVSVGLALVTSLIQQQTMCQVSDRAPQPRPYTDTDAAMCAPLIEDVLKRACDTAEVEADQTVFRNHRFGARAEDVRSLVLGLRARRYRVFSLTVDVALGRHQSEIILVLPDAEEEPAPAEETTPPAPDLRRPTSSPMVDVPVRLDAVLTRIRMPLSALNALKVGDTFPVSRSQLDETTLVSINGGVVAQGRLGRLKDNRAVRLMAPSGPPRVDRPEAPASFEAEATPALPAEDLAAEAQVVSPADYDVDLDPAELTALSAEEAADQITELAGLTEEDLQSVEAQDLSDALAQSHLPAITDRPEV